MFLLPALVLAFLPGCGAGGGGGGDAATIDPGDAAAKAGDREASTAQRAAALEALWASAQAGGDQQIDAAREEMKKVLWKGGAPQALREAALACLFSDERPSGRADTANFLRLRLPTEPQYGVLKKMCEGIAARADGTSDSVCRRTASGLVRSWARPLPSPPDDQRPERLAMAALFPDRSVEDAVFEVFLDPVAFGAKPASGAADADGGPLLGGGLSSPPDSAIRVRSAAWDVLGRIDRRGVRRAALLSGANATPTDDPLIAGLRRAASELGVVPITGSELTWLQTLLASSDERVRAWWSATSSAVAQLSAEQRDGLQLRHLESVRWASLQRTAWLRASRSELRTELDTRLSGRKTYRVGQADGADFINNRNRPTDWERELTWGDVLTILVIDEALTAPGVRAALGQQAAADRVDTSTEWGGSIYDASVRAVSAERSGFEAVVYQSRPAQRVNDRTFVAADEMFGVEGALGLAHYHFHVQVVRNDAYAGPGKGDREYAELHNRNCLVFTSIREGVLNADYYQRGGATVDLGEIIVPK